MVRSVPFFVLAALAAVAPAAQTLDVWSDASGARLAPRAEIADYRVVRLDEPALRAGMAPVADGAPLRLAIPRPGGGALEVAVRESSVMAPELQARYPEIRTYLAEGSGVSGRLSLTDHGFKGLLFGPDGAVVVDPSESGSDLYLVYWAEDLVVPEDLLASLGDDAVHVGAHDPAPGARRAPAIGTTLRTYRLAVSARGEYVQRNGGTVQTGMAAVAAAVNRLNALYERDLAVTFELVANNHRLVHTDPDTDPFEGRGAELFGANKQSIDRIIGVTNYDVDHVIGYDEGGGVAYVGAVCNGQYKAGGVSGGVGVPAGAQ